MVQTKDESDSHLDSFLLEELRKAMEHLKLGKATGIHGISTEVLKHFGPKLHQWTLDLFNTCATASRIPKPGEKLKATDLFLYYILFKLYERLIIWDD